MYKLPKTFANKLDAKITVVTAIFSICPGLIAQAQEINSVEDYQLYCSSAAYYYDVESPECEKYKPVYEQQRQQESNDENSSPTIDNAEETPRSTQQVRGYIGGSLGAFFPDSDFGDTGFGGSIFLGANFNKNIGLELETILLGGGTELDIADYSAWALFINPRFNLPLDANSQDAKISLFLSPGIGISQAEIDIDEFDLEAEDETRFTIQVKAGIEYNISRSNSIFVQGRYVTQTLGNSEYFSIDTYSNEFFSVEAGTKFSF